MVKLALSIGNLFNSVDKSNDVSVVGGDANSKPYDIVDHSTDDSVVDVDSKPYDDIDSAFELFEKERLHDLSNEVKDTLREKVIPRCARVLSVGIGSSVEVSEDTLNNVVSELVHLGEQEPYGVMGGTLILNYGSILKEKSEKGKESQTPKIVRIGKFALGQGLASTFELHLTLYASTHLKHKVANLIRKLKGDQLKIVLCERFTMTKKKLYRAPSHFKYQREISSNCGQADVLCNED